MSGLSKAQERRVQRALQLLEARQQLLAEAEADGCYPSSKFAPVDVFPDPLPFGPNPPPTPTTRTAEIRAGVRAYLESVRGG